MTTHPRTIQIFLPNGDPSGIRVAELTTSILRLIEVPRSELADFLKMEEAHQVGLYFLVSQEDEQLYIGQSGDVGTRLKQHLSDESKDWWEKALVLVSLTNNLTQTHVLYLEYLSISKAKQCKRYTINNGNLGQRPHTPLPLQADCEEIHQLGGLLLATLGYPIFEPLLHKQAESDAEQTIFHFKRGGVVAQGIFTNEGMVVLKGSTAPTNTGLQKIQRLAERQQKLIEQDVIEATPDKTTFTTDYLFKSPSGAAGVLLQSASNGWVDWKTAAGVTLREYQKGLVDGQL